MSRIIPVLALLLATTMVNAQTIFRITNVTITEKDQVVAGNDATAEIRGAEGSDRVLIHASQDIELKSKVRVSTRNVRRSSHMRSAVNAIFEIDLTVDGKRDNRRVEKIFYMDQERTTRLEEKFVFKNGNKVRTVTVAFNAHLD